MRVQTVQLQLLDVVLLNVLANCLQATGGAGALKTAHVGLAKILPGFTPGMDPATVEECDYDGYARMPITWGLTGTSSDGRATVHSASALFSPTGAAVPGVAVGVVLFDSLTGGALLGVGSFPVPVEMATPLNDCTVVVVLSLPSAAETPYGTIVAVN